jgi:hypothetical protein
MEDIKEKTADEIKLLEQFAKYSKYYKEIDGRITMTIDLPLKLDLDKAINIVLKRYKELEERQIWSTATMEDLKTKFIPISVIQNKIDEIEESMNKARPFDLSYIEYCEDRIEVLQELLEERNK